MKTGRNCLPLHPSPQYLLLATEIPTIYFTLELPSVVKCLSFSFFCLFIMPSSGRNWQLAKFQKSITYRHAHRQTHRSRYWDPIGSNKDKIRQPNNQIQNLWYWRFLCLRLIMLLVIPTHNHLMPVTRISYAYFCLSNRFKFSGWDSHFKGDLRPGLSGL